MGITMGRRAIQPARVGIPIKAITERKEVLRKHLSLGKARQLWDAAWFGPMPSFNFALFRTGLGIVLTIWYLTLLQDLNFFFGENGLPNPGYNRSGISIFRWFTSDTVLWVGTLWGLSASALLALGRHARLAGPLAAIVTSSLMEENVSLWNSGDDLMQTFLILFALYCVITPSSDLNISLTAANQQPALQSGKFWLFRLIQIQMTIIYLDAFLAKIPGNTWRDGTATITTLRLETMERFYVPDWLQTNFFANNMLTWGTLVIEGALPILLWNRRSRPYAVALAVVFHLSIDWALAIGLFSWVMIVGLISFKSPQSGHGCHKTGDNGDQLRSCSLT